ncbi:transglutaminase-like domain-containing protein [Draconibacterium halophilum]|uniref:Transglutaminase domain-containing protein n=1 Tax=Draconibacterium halophilum TaxID=2706887 RepID=A0A6C0RCP6_9BACT|nr:transglutaminase domain-containing protein [Draconibacterium halophilum]QIA07879.1 transglutaminase domain-containing protein [Draconibacterium halophilum]
MFDFKKYLEEGKFSEAKDLLKEKLVEDSENEKFQIQLETISRLRKEFPYTRADVKERLSEYYPNLTAEELDKWEEEKQLEMRVIDGEKRYFSRAVSNFFRLNEAAGKIKDAKNGKAYDGVEDFQQTVIPQWFEKGIEPQKPFNKQQIKVNYSITLDANAVPAGEVVKCWLPYPRTGSKRLPQVEFMEASQGDYSIAPNETLQRTVYMEKIAEQDEETVFQISYLFETAAQWFNIKPDDVQPYNKSSELYKNYTAERLPHIVFTDEIKALAKSIVGDATNPVKQVKLIYYWINDNIPWAGALEYSTMSCIPCYVLENMHGDCGMQTFLFLSMARSLGIPAKWQSGWYLLPQTKNLHDWAEVYYEGVGWVPVDPSFKLIDSEDKRVKEFYLNGLDCYRLIVNDDFARELVPPKKYYRSEPFDFQRGELEWQGGNLYFDTWSYHLDFEYLPTPES